MEKDRSDLSSPISAWFFARTLQAEKMLEREPSEVEKIRNKVLVHKLAAYIYHNRSVSHEY